MSKLENFAERMNRIPRQIQKCEIYGTVRVVVNKRHAGNIFAKIDPCAKGPDIYHALGILQDRLDNTNT